MNEDEREMVDGSTAGIPVFAARPDSPRVQWTTDLPAAGAVAVRRVPGLGRGPELDVGPQHARVCRKITGLALMPVPGLVGVSEAGLVAGRTGVCVAGNTPVATALVNRLVSLYRPPIWGYVWLRLLTRHVCLWAARNRGGHLT